MVNPSICPPDTDFSPSGTHIELADVVRRFGHQYTSQYAQLMMPSQKRALSDIAACCTKELGGRLYRCDDCRGTFWRFHCCRNRACPKCHGTQTQQWLQQRQAELLPCDYFHAVATAPSELHDVFRREQKYMYGLLMKVSAEAVKELCAKKRYLGALPGILSVLHTWNGELRFHPHVHMLITGGGITKDGEHFEPARGKFLVPVALLSRKIAAKFRDTLSKEKPSLFAQIPATVWHRHSDTESHGTGWTGGIPLNVHILDDWFDSLKSLPSFNRLARHKVTVWTAHTEDAGLLADRLQEAEALVLFRERTPVGSELLEQLPNLRLISQRSVYPHVNVSACTANNVLLCSNMHSDTPSITASEMTFALILASARQLPQQIASLN